MKDSRNRSIAIHEAGHFVCAMKMQIGEVDLVTIEPKPGEIDSDGEQLAGYVRRRALPMERMIMAELRGDRPESILISDANTAADVQTYRMNRNGFLTQLIINAIAGTAAEIELAGGDELFSHSDIFTARRYAAMLVPEGEVTGFVKSCLEGMRAQCRGPLRDPILAVAERLQSRRTIEGAAACLALWQEVRPITAVPSGQIDPASPWANA